MADAPEVRVEVVCDTCRCRAVPEECPDCDGTGTEERTLTGLDALAVDKARKQVAATRADRAWKAEASVEKVRNGTHDPERYRALIAASDRATAEAAEAEDRLRAALLAEGGKDG